MLQQSPQDSQSWPHGVHLFVLCEFADEVHIGIVVDLWIGMDRDITGPKQLGAREISMETFKSEHYGYVGYV